MMNSNLEEWLLSDETETTQDEEDSPQDFRKYVSKNMGDIAEQTIESLETVWFRMGLSSNEISDRRKQLEELFLKAVNNVCKNSLETEQSSLEKLIQYNDIKLKEINEMHSDLTLPVFEAPTDRSLRRVGRILVYKYKELIALKNARIKQMTELLSKRDKLLRNMNMKAKEWRTATNIPNEEELMHLQSNVSDLVKERSKRFNKYQSFRKILEQLFVDLEREPQNEFEKHFLFENPEEFILSDEHMKKLQSLHSELESCYQQNNDRRKQMEKTLDSLWNKLEVDQSYRDLFYRNKNGCKPSVLALLEQEIIKYEELKRQNIELFIQKVRQELNEWYDKCYISDKQKDKLRPFVESMDFSEELLDIHETEVKRIQEYYEECEEMFDKLEEWHELWERFKELENKANDPNRFNNRGGALLAEEREKNQIKKKLPKLESVLKKFSEDRFREKSEYFEVLGVPIKSYVENLKMEYQDLKENEKKERQRLKQMELNPQMKGKKATPSCVVVRKTPVKRTFTPSSPAAANGGSISKMRRVGAPLTPSKLTNEINTNTMTKRANPNKGQPIPRARARNLEYQMNQMADTPNIEGSVLSIDEDQFQAPLGDRDYANSTFISSSRPQTPSRFVTKRREPKGHAMTRRMSRSCNDLSEAINNKLQLNSGKKMGSIRSTPSSPQPKSAYGCTPTRGPSRIAIPQRKRPFLI